jgi:hypothetical protein
MWRSDDKETDRVGDSEISQEISSLESVLGTNLGLYLLSAHQSYLRMGPMLDMDGPCICAVQRWPIN